MSSIRADEDTVAKWKKQFEDAHLRRVRISIRKERMYAFIQKIAECDEARAIVSEVEK